jgi:hypothetical protein
LNSTDRLFFESIQAIKNENYSEAEGKLKKVIHSKKENWKKGEIILAFLLLRKECERLIGKLDRSGG